MQRSPDMIARPPGMKWVLILAAAGFAAGFFGPMVFVPDANQGPLVGILISGPAGFVLGLVLWVACAIVRLPASIQWRMLYTVAAVGTATTLLLVQPDPKSLGDVYEAEVLSCATPRDREVSVLEYWDKRVAAASRSTPRAGWRVDLQDMLRDAPGAVIRVRMLRTNVIRQHRKPWDHRQSAAGWQEETREIDFYDDARGCAQYPEGSQIRGFQQADYDARMAEANVWPPKKLLYVLTASAILPVPPRWAGL